MNNCSYSYTGESMSVEFIPETLAANSSNKRVIISYHDEVCFHTEQLYYPKVVTITPSCAATATKEAEKGKTDTRNDHDDDDMIDTCKDLITEDDDDAAFDNEESTARDIQFQQKCEEEDFEELLHEVIVTIFD